MPAIRSRLYRQRFDTACVLALLANFPVEPAFGAVDSGGVHWSESNAIRSRLRGKTRLEGQAASRLHEAVEMTKSRNHAVALLLGASALQAQSSSRSLFTRNDV